MITFTPERIAELRELADKATPRPWAMCGCGKCEHVDSIPADCSVLIGDAHVKVAENEGYPYAKNTRDNTIYIVEATSTLPAALDEIERLQARIVELTAMANTAYEPYRTQATELMATLKTSNDEIEQLRKALTWYADESHYLRGGVMATRARDALKGGE